MSPEEISNLPDNQIIALAKAALGDDPAQFNPMVHDCDATYLASELGMTISFGESAVYVSRPQWPISRAINYGFAGRTGAMRRAVTLLAADYSQFI